MVEIVGRDGLREARSRTADEWCGAPLPRSERQLQSSSITGGRSLTPCVSWRAVKGSSLGPA